MSVLNSVHTKDVSVEKFNIKKLIVVPQRIIKRRKNEALECKLAFTFFRDDVTVYENTFGRVNN